MILAAGLGTRLRPWTLEHPKALVPVGKIPMLERVIDKLRQNGVDEFVVNIHHFGNQILDFFKEKEFDCTIEISDERDQLLDTGGGILKAADFFGDESVLIHNVDILSNADIREMMNIHISEENDVTLLTSSRTTSRYLMFDRNSELCGWHNHSTNEYRPENASYIREAEEAAFSGIYIVGPKAIDALKKYKEKIGKSNFPIMDFFLSFPQGIKIGRYHDNELKLLDIGKPDMILRAEEMLKELC